MIEAISKIGEYAIKKLKLDINNPIDILIEEKK